MRTLATAAAAVSLLLASPALATHQRNQLEFSAIQNMGAGEERLLTSTTNLRVELFCNVLDGDDGSHAVEAHVEIIGPNTRRSKATKAPDQGIGWGTDNLGIPNEVIFRFVASGEAPNLPDWRLAPSIRVQLGRSQFIELTPILIGIEALEGFPCVYRFGVRQR